MNCRKCEKTITFGGKEKQLIKRSGEHEFHLSICENCLIIHFPDYLTKNKSRIFNSWNNITKFAFNISDDTFMELKKKTYIRDFTDDYRKKLSRKNTLEFHIEKYGDRGEEIYSQRCKSRAVTLENLIRRYGEEGKKRWESYRAKQSYTESLQYCLDKFGNEGYRIFVERCKNKQLSLDRFTKKYGEVIGKEKWESYRKKYIESFQRRSPHSKKSQQFFTKLREKLSNLTIYDSSNGEKFFVDKNGNFASVDFFIEEINLVIEYYGDFWHANPAIYSSDDKIHTSYTAKDIWERDANRLKIFNHTKTIIVWELNANDDKINELVNLIENELRNRN